MTGLLETNEVLLYQLKMIPVTISKMTAINKKRRKNAAIAEQSSSPAPRFAITAVNMFNKTT